MEFIPVIIHALWCAVSDWPCFLKIFLSHTATLGTGKIAYLYWLEINAEKSSPLSNSITILSRIELHRAEVILRLPLYCLRDIRLGISILYSCSFANNNGSLSIPTASNVIFNATIHMLKIWEQLLFLIHSLIDWLNCQPLACICSGFLRILHIGCAYDICSLKVWAPLIY